MDALRRHDLSRDDARRRCIGLDARLATVDTDDEFEFIKREIRRSVTLSGQELAHEQWWTGGIVQQGVWVWDRRGYPAGSILKTPFCRHIIIYELFKIGFWQL